MQQHWCGGKAGRGFRKQRKLGDALLSPPLAQDRNKLFGPVDVGDCAGSWRDPSTNAWRPYNLTRVAGDAIDISKRDYDNEMYYLNHKAKEWMQAVSTSLRLRGWAKVQPL